MRLLVVIISLANARKPVNCPTAGCGRHLPARLGGLVKACPTEQRCDSSRFCPEVIGFRALPQPSPTDNDPWIEPKENIRDVLHRCTSTLVCHRHRHPHSKPHTFAVFPPRATPSICKPFQTRIRGCSAVLPRRHDVPDGDLDTLWIIEISYGTALAHLVAPIGYLVVDAPRMLNKTR